MSSFGNYHKFYIIFSICGFYEVNFTKFRKIFCILNFLIIFAIISYVGFKWNTMISLISPVSSFSDSMMMFSITLSVVGIFVQTIRKQKSFNKILQNLKQVDNLFDEDLFLESQDYTMRFVVIVLYTVVVETNIYLEIRIKEEEWGQFWVFSIYQLAITRFWYLNHLMHVNFITKRLQLINRMFENILSSSWDDTQSLRHDIRKIKIAYRLSWNSMWHMNKIFGITQMFNFGQCFIELVAEFYWIYLYFIHKPKNIYATAYVWTPTILFIYLLLSEGHKIRRIHDDILSNLNRTHFIPEKRGLVKLSYQVMTNKLYFHAGNFFVIDFELVKSMVRSLTVYLVIIIQFIPKNN